MADDVTSVSQNSNYTYQSSKLTNDSVILGKDASQLGMDDFFNLLVAQMTNQDMLNPQSDTEFIAQMAQFTTLQGIQTITEYQLSSYAVSYVGKEVVIAQMDDAGKLEQVQGIVTNVTFYDGEPMVVVNGKAYALYTVMEIINEGSVSYKDKETDKVEEPADDDPPQEGTGTPGDEGTGGAQGV